MSRRKTDFRISQLWDFPGWVAYHNFIDPALGPHSVKIRVENRRAFRGYRTHIAVKGKNPLEALSRLKKQLGMQ